MNGKRFNKYFENKDGRRFYVRMLNSLDAEPFICRDALSECDNVNGDLQEQVSAICEVAYEAARENGVDPEAAKHVALGTVESLLRCIGYTVKQRDEQ